ncbi:sensor domain-containing diguanylate cyclase [Alteraurantiacibacter buctensis]|nr:sensor domain-containing diguanylate cyclase [Alteraurantiacibacter buctensis]
MQIALGVGVLYAPIAIATIFVSSNGHNHAAIWLADAVGLAALLTLPRRDWPFVIIAIVIANHLANDITRGFEWGHILYGMANAGQVLLAGTLVRSRGANPLASAGSLSRFFLWAGLVAPLCGAAVGSLVSWWLYQQPYDTSMIRWFASNSLGFLVGTPLFRGLFDGSLRISFSQLNATQRQNMAGLLAVFTLIVYTAFSWQRVPLLFLPVCALVMVAVWLGRVGVTVAIMIVALVATATMMSDYGPLDLLAVDDFRKATFFQIYLGLLLATGLLVAAIVTSRGDAMAKLAEREHMLSQLLKHGKEVILSLDAEGRCKFCVGPAKSLLGLASDDIVGCTLVELAQRLGIPFAVVDASECAARSAPYAQEFQLARARRTWVEVSIAPIILDGCLSSSVVTFRDVTMQRVRAEDLQRRAFTDELTQVLNRAGFERQFEHLLQTSGPLSLALIDLDSFKSINDTFGHSSGDEALAVIADIIGAHTRKEDVVGRIGGDEFAILFRTEPAIALAACERICKCVEETQIFATDRRLMNVTISCGVATMPPEGNRQALFDAADMALYSVKHHGRNGARLAA